MRRGDRKEGGKERKGEGRGRGKRGEGRRRRKEETLLFMTLRALTVSEKVQRL